MSGNAFKNPFSRLDDFYEQRGNGLLSNIHNNRYKKYQSKFDIQDKELIEQIKKECEMVILSDNL